MSQTRELMTMPTEIATGVLPPCPDKTNPATVPGKRGKMSNNLAMESSVLL
jgi:hypothetical protein